VVPSNAPDPGPPPTATEAPVATEALAHAVPSSARVRRFELRVAEGLGEGASWESSGDRCSIGSHASNDLVLQDPTVSRFHCEVRIDDTGALIRDLGSRNGTMLDGVVIKEAYLRDGSVVHLGRTTVRFQFSAQTIALPISERGEFGSLVGTSVAMRTTFALLERAAATDSTILLEGETGTGKEGAAASVHEASARRDKPFVVVDCGSMPPDLLESELFGHEKGAFTGAAGRRIGAFEEASGGTIFLDEIGELPMDLQPKLLRVLESRQVRKVGSNLHQPIDIRIIAATNRDLRGEVNDGRFRSDLYYRLAVIKVRLPPLRERPEDVQPIVERLLQSLGAEGDTRASLQTSEFLANVKMAAWPGNVRELRNYLERCIVFRQPLPVQEPALPNDAARGGEGSQASVDTALPYDEARQRILDAWERRYLESLLRAHQGNVERAARAAGIGRAYMYRLVGRHRLLARHRSDE